MLKRDELKDKVSFHLLNFGKTKWLPSEYFFEALVEKFMPDDEVLFEEQLKRFKGFQRELADITSSIFADQMTYKQFLLISSNKGYKIAVTEEECFIGRNYLYSKVDEQLQKIKHIDWYRVEKYGGKDKTADIFMKEIPV